jgi:RsmE family RNA methyltransferase
MNLLILTPEDRLEDDRYCISDHRADHVREVLKLAPGDSLEVGLLNGGMGTAVVEGVATDGVTIKTESLTPPDEPTPVVDLICALPRPQTLKKVLLVSAMMGVRRLHLVRANRVEKSYFQSPLLQPENYEPHLIEGLSQGKLTRMPRVTVHERFRTFFEDRLAGFDTDHIPVPVLRLLPDPESDRSLISLYSPQEGPPASVLVAVGPEGGWVPFEVELIQRVGFQRFKLGRFVLRVETAVTATLAQLELLRMRS